MNYSDSLKSMFAKYGFISTPLNDNEINQCEACKLTLDEAYSLGCDIECTDYSFDELLSEITSLKRFAISGTYNL